jgi:uncharacterized protein (DUF4415 family)
MSDRLMRRASLAEIRRMQERGELFHDPAAPEGERLGPEFWAAAEIEGPRPRRSVHLKLDPDVFDFFYAETGGKGHLTRMQNVLWAYVNARRHS